MNTTDIEYQAEAFINSRIPFDVWVKSKGFARNDADRIKAEVLRQRMNNAK